MKSPGITVRPLILMDGEREVNEVFFDQVKVPASNLVFEEGKGWTGSEVPCSATSGSTRRASAHRAASSSA
jgi:alkylation response protein AidB-like acyl-CoA dehydrogenase